LSMKKWLMKQYWRVSEIRILTSLAMGMLVIGGLYVDFVPILGDWGLWGALTLGVMLFAAFLFLGWIYDTRIRMWSQKNQAIIERSAYYYVPMISTIAFEYPVLRTIVETLSKVCSKEGINNQQLEDLAIYLNKYKELDPSREGIKSTIKISEEFNKLHPFTPTHPSKAKSVSIFTRLKIAWEVQVLRLTWIQGLTGLFQDVLVFGVFYVFIIYPFATEESALWYATFGISLPLLVAFITLGWVYDKKLRIWSVDSAVRVERNPYSYVAEPAQLSFTIPFFYALFSNVYNIQTKLGIDSESVRNIIHFLDNYVKLTSSKDQDLGAARDLRDSHGTIFMEE